MGAAPGEAYLGVVLPPALGDDDVLALHRGAEALAAESGVTIAGGDLARGPALTLAVTVVGWAAAPTRWSAATARGRATASASPDAGRARPPAWRCSTAARSGRDALVERYLRPRPRLAAGRALAAAGASAMLDLSDGLASDARRIAEASGVRHRARRAACRSPGRGGGGRRAGRCRRPSSPRPAARTTSCCACVAAGRATRRASPGSARWRGEPAEWRARRPPGAKPGGASSTASCASGSLAPPRRRGGADDRLGDRVAVHA